MRAGSVLGLVVALVLGGLGAVVSETVDAGSAPAAAAPPASAYDHGMIISDTVFRDFGALSEAQIQSFFRSRVPSCPSAPSSRKCLTEYRGNTISKSASANGCTQPISARSNVTAARMVAEVAKACQINPRVLIVLMQKEQSLVTTTNPTDWQIKNATGWGCPDTAPCQTNNRGLFHQLYAAAWQFNQYFKNRSFFSWYPVGKTSSIMEHPKSAYTKGSSKNPNRCTKRSVTIKNNATAALYYYTPYYPNSRALGNMYGLGNSCSSYGNRNFWRLYHDWFGSTQGGTYLAKTKTGSTTYLLVGDQRYAFPKGDSELLVAYRSAYGKVGTVSSDYLNSFTTGGLVSRVILDAENRPFIVDAGNRHRVVQGCDAVADFGFSCDGALRLTQEQLDTLTWSTAFNGYVASPDGRRYVLVGGKKHQVIDEEAAASRGITLPSEARPHSAGLVSMVTPGQPLLNEGSLIRRTDDSMRFVYADGTFYGLNSALRKQTQADRWWGAPRAAVDRDVIAASGSRALPGVLRAVGAEEAYHLAASGLVLLENPGAFSTTITEVPQTLLDAIPRTAVTRSAPLIVRSVSSSKQYLIHDGTRHGLSGSSHRSNLAKSLGIRNTLLTLPDAVIASIPGGAYYRVPGQVLVDAKSGAKWIMATFTTKVRADNALLRDLLGSKFSQSKLKTSSLTKIASQPGRISRDFRCGEQHYLALNGKLYRLSAEAAADFAPTFGFPEYSAELCARLALRSDSAGSLLQAAGVYYEISDGRKRRITATEYRALATERGGAKTASAALLASIPNAAPAPLPPPQQGELELSP